MIYLPSVALFDRLFRLLLSSFVVFLFLALTPYAAVAKSSERPRVYVDASLVKGLVLAPVPSYPSDALQKSWSGFGVFELRFRPDGTVKDVITVLTTEHQVLDKTAQATLWRWRSKPGGYSSARLTIDFSIHHDTVRVDPNQALKGIPVHPYPTYPIEARRHRWIGTGLFIIRFRPDGSVEKVVALKSTDNPLLDQECVTTLGQWRCLPDHYRGAYVPITFSLSR